MTISYPVPTVLKQQFAKIAEKRGYNEELSEQYVEDRTNLYKKQAPVGDAIFMGTIAATAGKIALDSRAYKKKSPILRAIKAQFLPLTQEIDKSVKEFTKFLKKAPVKNTISSFVKNIAKSMLAGLKFVGRSYKGLWNSIPKAIKIPAAVLMGLHVLGSYSENNKMDAKYDTLQHIENHKN